MQNKRNILFIGELDPNGRTYQRKRALEEVGYEVFAFSAQPESVTLDGSRSLLARLRWKLGFPLDSVGINKVILQNVKKFNPNILWIEKGNTVYPSTLRAVKKISPHTKIIAYLEDDMFARHNRSWYFTRGIKYYTRIFTTKSYNCNQDELPALGAQHVVFVNNAYDLHNHAPVIVTPNDVKNFGGDVGFIGTYETERADSILYLATHGVRIRVWGNGWQDLTDRDPNLKIESRAIYGQRYARAICATKINLCFLRKANRDRQTTRSIDIPACGAFMLAERTAEHTELFKEGVEAEYFASNLELLKKIKHYLTHEEERKAIAANGRQRCISGKYDYHSLLTKILHDV